MGSVDAAHTGGIHGVAYHIGALFSEALMLAWPIRTVAWTFARFPRRNQSPFSKLVRHTGQHYRKQQNQLEISSALQSPEGKKRVHSLVVQRIAILWAQRRQC